MGKEQLGDHFKAAEAWAYSKKAISFQFSSPSPIITQALEQAQGGKEGRMQGSWRWVLLPCSEAGHA